MVGGDKTHGRLSAAQTGTCPSDGPHSAALSPLPHICAVVSGGLKERRRPGESPELKPVPRELRRDALDVPVLAATHPRLRGLSAGRSSVVGGLIGP